MKRVGVLAASCVALVTATFVTSAAQQVGPATGESLSQSYRGSQSDNVAYQKVSPIKVFDNLYYVGPGSVSVWLIPTSDGVILIDTAQEPLVDHVIDSIRKVGFDPEEHQVHPAHARAPGSLRRRRQDPGALGCPRRGAPGGLDAHRDRLQESRARQPGPWCAVHSRRGLARGAGSHPGRDDIEGVQDAWPYAGLGVVCVYRLRQRPAAQGARARRAWTAERRRGRYAVSREYPASQA